MPSPILARADALMHRRRPAGGESDDIPILTDTVDEDDIPLLVDRESSAVGETPPPVNLPAGADASPPSEMTGESMMYEPIIRELARHIDQRLHDELPRIVESAVCEFLAERVASGPLIDTAASNK